MKRIALSLALLLGLTFTKTTINESHYVNQEVVDRIKAHGKWQPKELHENPLKDVPMEQLKKKVGGLLGVHPEDPFSAFIKKINNGVLNKLFLHEPKQAPVKRLQSTLAAFNWIDDGGAVSSCIYAVRDQASCGSCWAFAATGFLEDRFCIKSNAAVSVRLAPEDMVTCDFQN